MARRSSRWLSPLGLGALALPLTFGAAFAPGQVLLGTDAYLVYLPLRTWMHAMAAQGLWPQWIPFDGAGTPLLGSLVPMALDPTTLISLPLAGVAAVKAQVALAYLTAIAGTFLLARALRLPTLAAAFGALAYACTGYLVSLSSNPVYLASAARIPLVLWAALRLGQRGQPRHAAALALAMASLLYCGDPEALLLATLAAVPLALGGLERWRARLPLLATAGALTALMSLVLVLPALHTFGASTRAAGLDPGEALEWSFHPVRLAELLVGPPLLYADGPTMARFGPHNGGFWSLSCYLGAGVVALAVRGLLRPGARWPKAAAMAAALALVLAMGRYGGLYAHLSLLMHFRYPEKLVPWAALAAALLAARGLAGVGRGRWRWLFVALAMTLVASWVGAAWAPGLLVLGLRAAAVIAAVGLAVRFVPWPTARAAIVALIALLDLAHAAQPVLLHGDARQWLPTASAIPEAQPGERICSDLELRGFEGVSDSGLGHRRAQRLTLPYSLAGLFGLRGVGSLIPTETPDFALLCSVLDRCGTPCAKLQGARWEFVQRDAAPALVATGEYRKVRDLDTPRATLLEDLHPIPYATVRPAQLYAEAFAVAAALHQGHLAAGTTALLARSEAPAGADDWKGAGTATAMRARPDRIRIQASASAPAVLVVQEAYDPDWQVRLDGQRAPLLRADFGLVGVALPGGEHVVELELVPWGIAWTPFAALFGLLASAALVAYDLRRARRGALTSPAAPAAA